MTLPEGWHGWDDYARFYDWENARTFGTRDVAFWRRLARRGRGRVLELGCGTGRLLLPIARTGRPVTGVDRSFAMLSQAQARVERLRAKRRPDLIRADIRDLPFASEAFTLIMAPYGLLQSLVRDADLDRALSEAARVLRRGGLFVADLVPDLPGWESYRRQVRLQGRFSPGASVTLVESVRQQQRLGLTIFDEEFVERRNGRPSRRRFSLTFRTRPLEETGDRIARAGFRIQSVLGDYRGRRWTPASEAWLIVARKR